MNVLHPGSDNYHFNVMSIKNIGITTTATKTIQHLAPECSSCIMRQLADGSGLRYVH